MILDYWELISYSPIKLSIGSIRKPKLEEIDSITFALFSTYEAFLKLTPKQYYSNIIFDGEKNKWEIMKDDEKSSATMFKIILSDERLKDTYLEILNFFFAEKVVFQDDFFVVLKGENKGSPVEQIDINDIVGVINEDTLPEVLHIIQQICGIADKEPEDTRNLKFKNEKARRLYEKMKKAKDEQDKIKKEQNDENLSIPNIISSVSSKHPSLNYTNIWKLTIYQLLDTFNRLQNNAIYDIDSLRASVWGDEKKTFNPKLWYEKINQN